MSFSESILVAEDDEADRFLLQHALGRAGVSVSVAYVRDGLEGIEYLRRRAAPPWSQPPPSLLLLDIQMPRMNGFELLECLREEPALRPRHVVVFSSSEEPQDVRRAAAFGVDHYMVKPCCPAEMVGVVRRLEEYWRDEVSPAVLSEPALVARPALLAPVPRA